MDLRKYNCITELAPEITTHSNLDFIINFQKAMLLSLIKRNLLTHEQMDCVISKIEEQYRIE